MFLRISFSYVFEQIFRVQKSLTVFDEVSSDNISDVSDAKLICSYSM